VLRRQNRICGKREEYSAESAFFPAGPLWRVLDHDTGGSDLVARGAALGKAQAQVRAGQYDPAIESLKALSTQTTSDLPVDGVLMELAKAYRAAGKVDDARKTLNEIVEKHAESPFVGEARAELDKLKG